MEYINPIIDFLNNIARPILLTIATVFTLIFAWNKIGRNVTATYKVGAEKNSSTRIMNIVLTNKKDKSLSIYSIHAVFENDIWLKLAEFNPPKILKAFESIGVDLQEYSKTSIDGDTYKPDFFGKVGIYIETETDFLLCNEQKKNNSLKIYRIATTETYKFGDFVYDENVSYMLNYFYNSKSNVAFIHRSGYISNEWAFGVNHMGVEATNESIQSFIKDNEFENIFTNYICYKVEFPAINLAFKKAA